MIKLKLSVVLIFASAMSCDNLKNTNTQLEKEAVLNEISSSSNDLVTAEEKLPKGLFLLENSNCNVCHNQREKLIGPSYSEIALKYDEKSRDLLVDKIIGGGSGVWGEVSMPGHPDLKKTEISVMVDYILSIEQ